MLSLASMPESMIWGHTPATGHASDLLLTPMDRSPLPLSGGIPVKVRFFVFLCSATDAGILVPVWNCNWRRHSSTTWGRDFAYKHNRFFPERSGPSHHYDERRKSHLCALPSEIKKVPEETAGLSEDQTTMAFLTALLTTSQLISRIRERRMAQALTR